MKLAAPLVSGRIALVNRTGLSALLFGAAIAFCGFAPLAGQQPSDRRGAELSLGVGPGSLGISCAECAHVARQSGVSLHLWIAAPLSHDLLVGADILSWSGRAADTVTTASSLMVGASFYPAARSSWFLNGGIGVSIYDRSVTNPSLGIGFTFGTGADIRMARNVWLTPAAHLLWGAPGDVKNNEQLVLARGLTQNLIALDLNVSIRFPTTPDQPRATELSR